MGSELLDAVGIKPYTSMPFESIFVMPLKSEIGLDTLTVQL